MTISDMENPATCATTPHLVRVRSPSLHRGGETLASRRTNQSVDAVATPTSSVKLVVARHAHGDASCGLSVLSRPLADLAAPR